jgi:hypothetical protein
MPKVQLIMENFISQVESKRASIVTLTSFRLKWNLLPKMEMQRAEKRQRCGEKKKRSARWEVAKEVAASEMGQIVTVHFSRTRFAFSFALHFFFFRLQFRLKTRRHNMMKRTFYVEVLLWLFSFFLHAKCGVGGNQRQINHQSRYAREVSFLLLEQYLELVWERFVEKS